MTLPPITFLLASAPLLFPQLTVEGIRVFPMEDQLSFLANVVAKITAPAVIHSLQDQEDMSPTDPEDNRGSGPGSCHLTL